MGFSGYLQLLCSKGHYHTTRNYEFNQINKPNEFKCPFCDKPCVWINEVEDTNCDNYGIVDLEVITDGSKTYDEETDTVLHKPAIFKIPTE